MKAVQLTWRTWEDVCKFVDKKHFVHGIYLDDITKTPLKDNSSSDTIGLLLNIEGKHVVAKQNDFIIKNNGNYKIFSEKQYKRLQKIKKLKKLY